MIGSNTIVNAIAKTTKMNNIALTIPLKEDLAFF